MRAVTPLAGKARRSAELATRRLNMWEGSVRSAKTVSSLLTWTRFVLHGPPGNLLMIGKTERTLKRNVIDVLVAWLGPKRVRHVIGSGELWICGRLVYLAGANDERAKDKIQGLTLVGAYVDEASLVPESMWAMLLSRLSTDGARLFATTNPDAPAHWLLRDYLSRPALWLTADGAVELDTGPDTLDLARFSFRLADNPTLSPEYVKQLTREYVGLWRRRYIDGAWVVADGAIYEQWDPARHVVADLPETVRVLGAGVDYGTANPFVALMLAAGTDGVLYLTNEWRHDSRRARRQMTDPEYTAALIEWADEEVGVRPPWWYVDPSAASSILQAYRDGGRPSGRPRRQRCEAGHPPDGRAAGLGPAEGPRVLLRVH